MVVMWLGDMEMLN